VLGDDVGSGNRCDDTSRYTLAHGRRICGPPVSCGGAGAFRCPWGIERHKCNSPGRICTAWPLSDRGFLGGVWASVSFLLLIRTREVNLPETRSIPELPLADWAGDRFRWSS
jgi:hypothetical protein